jgi:hypothetical protein
MRISCCSLDGRTSNGHIANGRVGAHLCCCQHPKESSMTDGGFTWQLYPGAGGSIDSRVSR